MQITKQHKKYLLGIVVCIALGALAYGASQVYYAKQLAKMDALRVDGGWYATPVAQGGIWYRVPKQEIYASGISQGEIPALYNPAYTSVAEADALVGDDLQGVALEVGGVHYFYPVQVMNWHEVVQDVFDNGTPEGLRLMVYYGPLTGAATAYIVPGEQTFEVSGQEYNNDVFLRELGSETLWSGIAGIPMVASSQDALAQTLERYPTAFLTWGVWKDAHPDGRVLSFATGFDRDYARHPYGNYEQSPGVYFPVNHSGIPVRAKEPAYVAAWGADAGVFIQTALMLDTTPNISVGDHHLVALTPQQMPSPLLFNRVVGEQVLTFTRVGTSDVFTDAETETTWNAQGLALRGALAGTQLELLPHVRMYTFAANAMYPNAVLTGEEFIFDEEKDASGGAVVEDAPEGANIEIIPVE